MNVDVTKDCQEKNIVEMYNSYVHLDFDQKKEYREYTAKYLSINYEFDRSVEYYVQTKSEKNRYIYLHNSNIKSLVFR